MAPLQLLSHLQALPKQISLGMLGEHVDDLVVAGQQLIQKAFHELPAAKFIGRTGAGQLQIEEANPILDPIFQIVAQCLHFEFHPLACPACGQLNQGKGDGPDHHQKKGRTDIEGGA